MLVFPGRSHAVKLSKSLDFSFDFLVFIMRLGNGSNALVGRPPLSQNPSVSSSVYDCLSAFEALPLLSSQRLRMC